MRRTHRVLVGVFAAGVLGAAIAQAQISSEVPNAQPRSGTQPNVLAAGYTMTELARGTDALENPSGPITHYGHLNDRLDPASGGSGFATRTEPDENTYTATPFNAGGPDGSFDYGRHYLFQGHENGSNNKGQSTNNTTGTPTSGQAYMTRINLDVPRNDPHRITLLTGADSQGTTGLTRVDGSIYYPFSNQVLFSQEGSGTTGGIVAAPLRWAGNSPGFTSLYGVLGQGGYEGIHPDENGNLYIAEDIGGSATSVDPNNSNGSKKAKNPNSYIYKFVPTDRTDLTAGGKLYALQVSINGHNLTYGSHGGNAGNTTPCTGSATTGNGTPEFCDTWANDQVDLHTPGKAYKVTWVQVHDTVANGTAAFNANAAARTAGATPFLRPENLVFAPETQWRSFIFDETGDTNNDANSVPGLAARGAYGTLMRVDLAPDKNSGTISPFVIGDAAHSSFDNVMFSDSYTLLAAEDRGETLHQQLNALDSIWSYDMATGSAKRLLAQGRDPSATADASHVPPDSGASKSPSTFQNDGDNEPTGVFVSDGSISAAQILGWKDPGVPGNRTFFTQQHGDDVTYEITANPAAPPNGDRGDQGSKGDNGPKGDHGPAAAHGPAGAAGTRGKSQRTNCRALAKKVVCKQVSGGRASLLRGGRVYARGTAQKLVAVRRIRRGEYTLVLGSGNRAERWVVSIR
jgi:hypothetical protein